MIGLTMTLVYILVSIVLVHIGIYRLHYDRSDDDMSNWGKSDKIHLDSFVANHHSAQSQMITDNDTI